MNTHARMLRGSTANSKLNSRVDTEAMNSWLTGQTCLEIVRRAQTDEEIVKLYERMKDLPLVRWKDSIREVVGI